MIIGIDYSGLGVFAFIGFLGILLKNSGQFDNLNYSKTGAISAGVQVRPNMAGYLTNGKDI